MLGDENTAEELRELIAVPPRIEWPLRAYARAHPEEAHFDDRALKFREAVAREFSRLVRDGVPVADSPGVELDALMSGSSFRAAAPWGTHHRFTKYRRTGSRAQSAAKQTYRNHFLTGAVERMDGPHSACRIKWSSDLASLSAYL